MPIGGKVMAGMPPTGTALAVDLRNAPALVAAEAPGWSVVVTRFALVDARLIARVMPDLVLFPLFGEGFDALQVVERLVTIGYRGRLCCITQPLPAPEVVLRELEAANGGRSLRMVLRPS
ncbi:MAG: hypothetical protein ACK4TB_04925 [Gemmobacter sp.]